MDSNIDISTVSQLSLSHFTSVLLCSTLFCVGTMFSSVTLLAQDDMPENISQENGASPPVDILEYYKEHPILLPKARAKEIAKLPGITLAIARSIVRLMEIMPTATHQNLCDSIMATEDVCAILKMCTVLTEREKKNVPLVLYRARSNTQLSTQKGFSNGTYQGSPLDLYQRLTYNGLNAGSFASANIIVNKDPGEVSMADFVSGYIHLAPLANTTMVIGDYSIETGAGLMLWKGIGARKGPDVLSPAMQYGSGLTPYRSTLDYRFFRGVALEQKIPLQQSQFIARLWYSQLPRTASVDSSTSTISSFDIDGQYRSSTEIAKRGSVSETVIGTSLEFSTDSLQAGISAISVTYPYFVTSTSTSSFIGKSGTLMSVYGQYQYKTTVFLAEVFVDALRNIASTLRVEFATPTIKSVFAWRYNPVSIRSPFGFSFGEYLAPANEHGLYYGYKVKLAKSIELCGYADYYTSLSPRYGMPSSTIGIDLFNEMRWKISSSTLVTLRYRYEGKNDVISDTYRRWEVDYSRSSARAEVRYKAMNSLTFTTRLETSFVGYSMIRPHETGVAGFSEVQAKLNDYVTVGGRLALFTTPSFSSAIYLFEVTSPGLFSALPVYGDGMRSFAYIKYTPTSVLSLWLRYSTTSYNNRETISSGNNEIIGNSDPRLLLQLDVRW